MKEIIYNNDNINLSDITSISVRIKVLLINNGKLLIGNEDGCFMFIGGHKEDNEKLIDTLKREVKEETGANAAIVQYIGETHYNFRTMSDEIAKTVHWYLMMSQNYYSTPQEEEFFQDSGYYKFHEAVHLLKYANEKQMLIDAYHAYKAIYKDGLWKADKYFPKN